MKVLFLSSWFPTRINPLNGDFIERHALAVSRICSTAVIHVLADDSVKGRVFEIIEKNNLQLYEIIIYFKKCNFWLVPFAKFVSLLRYGIGYLIGYLILKKKFGKPDIIHANIIFPIGILAWVWSSLTGIPYIISEHWTLYLSEDISRLPMKRLTRQAVKRAFAIAPVTRDLELALQRHGYEGKFIAVPNVVDTFVFKPGPQVAPGDKIKILHVSSMKEEQKNIMGIIRTIKRLSDVRKDFMITFIGGAQALQKELAVALGIPIDMISFKGEMTHDEVADNMCQSHFLVLFSKAENLPCVILESLSCGLPVLSSDVGGIKEWIGEGQGLLVEPGNENELLKGLLFMLNNYNKFDRQNLHQYAHDNFGMEIIATRFLEIYKNAMYLKSNV